MKINPFLLFALILLTSGCYTTRNFVPIEIEILQPAFIYPASGNRIAATFYNNSNVRSDSINNGFVLDAKILYDTLNTDSAASVAYYGSMINSLRMENYYDTVIDLGKRYPDIGNDSILLLTKVERDSLINKFNCGIIYSLCQFEAYDISYTQSVPNEIGIIIFIKAIWEIYSSDYTDSLTLIYHKDTVTFSSPYYSTGAQEKILNDRFFLLRDAANDFGAKFALFLVPHWQDVERLYYKSRNLQLKLADEYVKNNEWLKAAEIWKQLTTNRNKNIAAKSMFNLAIACEMEGSYDAALDWVIKSYYVFSDKNHLHANNCKDYIRVLSRRKIEKKALEKQLGKPVR